MDAQIAGILVLNAHRASDASGEGFAVRLFRGANRSGFVRALTDQPTALTAGFAKVYTSCMQTARPRLARLFANGSSPVPTSMAACVLII